MIDIAHLLYKNKIKNVCISPGLRNTAISLTFIKHGKFNCHSIIDERSAGYFALGMALKTNTASALICTSGTATANYLPAIIEASQSKVPLIIITADRPANLFNTGENQTINQNNIYGDFVRVNLDLNENDNIINDINDSLKFVNGKYDNVITGPIHFNIHLDDFKNFNNKIKPNKIQKKIFNQSSGGEIDFNWNNLSFEDVFNIHNYQKPLIIIGRLNYKLDMNLIIKLSKHLKAPILTDSLSQIRFNSNENITLYDHYIDHDKINPDLIIRFGQKPVSKKLCNQLDKWKNKALNQLGFSSLLIDKSGRFNDDSPSVIQTNYKQFVNFIIKNAKRNDNTEYYDYIHTLDKKIKTIINNENQWSELMIAKSCLSSIKNDENLIISNSMPIRYIDMLGNINNNENINTYSNRGASGIDGIISTALGISYISKEKTTLLIGDLSFIYDQSSLIIAKQLKINLNILIINNNGGGIFSLLPVSKKIDQKIFNKYWTTSPNLSLKKIADLYDCHYQKVDSQKQLNSILIKYNKPTGINIIDIHIDIKKNEKILINLKKKIKKGIV